LEAVIWGMRFKGCAISDEEINEILQLEWLSLSRNKIQKSYLTTLK
jgi:hypothetical protein